MPIQLVNTNLYSPYTATNQNKPLIIRALCLVFVLAIGFLRLPAQATDQAPETNQQVYERLLRNFLSSNELKFQQVEGFTTPAIDLLLQPDSSAKKKLVFDSPMIQLKKLSRASFERHIIVDFRLEPLEPLESDTTATNNPSQIVPHGTSVQNFGVESMDTLSKKELMKARKTKYLPLRGDDPRATAKILLPLAAIVSGISVLISLFYLRS